MTEQATGTASLQALDRQIRDQMQVLHMAQEALAYAQSKQAMNAVAEAQRAVEQAQGTLRSLLDARVETERTLAASRRSAAVAAPPMLAPPDIPWNDAFGPPTHNPVSRLGRRTPDQTDPQAPAPAVNAVPRIHVLEVGQAVKTGAHELALARIGDDVEAVLGPDSTIARTDDDFLARLGGRVRILFKDLKEPAGFGRARKIAGQVIAVTVRGTEIEMYAPPQGPHVLRTHEGEAEVTPTVGGRTVAVRAGRTVLVYPDGAIYGPWPFLQAGGKPWWENNGHGMADMLEPFGEGVVKPSAVPATSPAPQERLCRSCGQALFAAALACEACGRAVEVPVTAKDALQEDGVQPFASLAASPAAQTLSCLNCGLSLAAAARSCGACGRAVEVSSPVGASHSPAEGTAASQPPPADEGPRGPGQGDIEDVENYLRRAAGVQGGGEAGPPQPWLQLAMLRLRPLADPGQPDEDSRLRWARRAIALAKLMPQAPPVPEAARQAYDRGGRAVRELQGFPDLNKPLMEFRSATTLAPWVANGWLAEAAVMEAMGLYAQDPDRLEAAAQFLKMHLAAAPDSADRPNIESQIKQLEDGAMERRLKNPWGGVWTPQGTLTVDVYGPEANDHVTVQKTLYVMVQPDGEPPGWAAHSVPSPTPAWDFPAPGHNRWTAVTSADQAVLSWKTDGRMGTDINENTYMSPSGVGVIELVRTGQDVRMRVKTDVVLRHDLRTGGSFQLRVVSSYDGPAERAVV